MKNLFFLIIVLFFNISIYAQKVDNNSTNNIDEVEPINLFSLNKFNSSYNKMERITTIFFLQKDPKNHLTKELSKNYNHNVNTEIITRDSLKVNKKTIIKQTVSLVPVNDFDKKKPKNKVLKQ